MADMHLEWPFQSLGADGACSRLRREELKAIFAGIIDLARQERVQVLLIAGDLFEHAHAGRGLIKFIDDQFRRIPDVAVFIAPGNHDPYVEGSYYQLYPWAPNVHIFTAEAERVDLPDLPVSVFGWGFGRYEVREWQMGQAPPADPSRINLAVFHGGDVNYHHFTPADLGALGMDYIALGHIHKEGVVLEQAGRVVARYSGSPEALSFGEPGDHGVYLVDVSKEYSRFGFVSTGKRRFITTTVDVSGVEDLAAAVKAVAPAEERQVHCYRLTLVGAVDPGLQVDLPLLQEQLAGEFYLLRLSDGTQPAYDLEALAAERSARGLFVQRMLAMGADQPRVRRALALGLAAFATGKEGAR